VPDPPRCPMCGSTDGRKLSNPHGSRSLRSDLVILEEPLSKVGCADCGLVYRGTLPETRALRQMFGSGYKLYAHAPGKADGASRQRAYAQWITEELGGNALGTIFEAGCGNGSLLLELRRLWPQTACQGVDPSAEAVAHGRAYGLALEVGFVTGGPERRMRADAALAINVIEHTVQPQLFGDALRQRVCDGGAVVVVCPLGDIASTELLFNDHMFSFTEAHLRLMYSRAGMKIDRYSRGKGDLGLFQMIVGRS
jgi:SAM-dependent methyltransferase